MHGKKGHCERWGGNPLAISVRRASLLFSVAHQVVPDLFVISCLISGDAWNA